MTERGGIVHILCEWRPDLWLWKALVCSVEPTPPLSEEGTREVLEEMRNPPADTPERRAMFARLREFEARRKRRRIARVRSPK